MSGYDWDGWVARVEGFAIRTNPQAIAMLGLVRELCAASVDGYVGYADLCSIAVERKIVSRGTDGAVELINDMEAHNLIAEPIVGKMRAADSA